MSRLNRINHDIDWKGIFCSLKAATTQISISVARSHTNSKIIHMFHLVVFLCVCRVFVFFTCRCCALCWMPDKTNDDKRFEWNSLANVIDYNNNNINTIRICSLSRIFRVPANHNHPGKKAEDTFAIPLFRMCYMKRYSRFSSLIFFCIANNIL